MPFSCFYQDILRSNSGYCTNMNLQFILFLGYNGDEKLEQARDKVRAELTKYNISMTDKDLDTFVESAVKQMNDAWKGEE